jgi:hypothetical protein
MSHRSCGIYRLPPPLPTVGCRMHGGRMGLCRWGNAAVSSDIPGFANEWPLRVLCPRSVFVPKPVAIPAFAGTCAWETLLRSDAFVRICRAVRRPCRRTVTSKYRASKKRCRARRAARIHRAFTCGTLRYSSSGPQLRFSSRGSPAPRSARTLVIGPTLPPGVGPVRFARAALLSTYRTERDTPKYVNIILSF